MGKIYKTAMYVRLSKGDEDKDGVSKSESDSVVNQKLLIENFIADHQELKLCGTYIDDGFTGTNFDRPMMKKMMADIDSGKIDCVVCKDISRFGRERIETGKYIARVFKEKGVRFIAINDHYDTLTADGAQTHIVMPIKALTNDSFSRDISIKVRSSQAVKREKGECLSPFAPYGYRKSAEDRNLLVPDEYAAKIVKDIFYMKINGYSASGIATELNEKGILSPAEYKKSTGQRYATSFRKGKKSRWSAQAVTRILRNEVYVGNLLQGKRSRVSYKVRKELTVPREEWARCDGAHKPVVNRIIFDTVQMLMERDTMRIPGEKRSYMYSGMLFCADCGSTMVRRNDSRNKEKDAVYICSGYSLHRKCTRHSISEKILNEAVREYLENYIQQIDDMKRIVKSEELGRGYDSAKRNDAEIVRLRKEMEKYSVLKASLYQDLRDGLISEEQFARYRQDYSGAEKEISDAIAEQERLFEEVNEKGVLYDLKLSGIQKKLSVGGLDRMMVVFFIDRILVHEDGRLDVLTRFDREIDIAEEIMAYGEESEEF